MDILSETVFGVRARIMAALAVATAMAPAMVRQTAQRVVPLTRTGELVRKYSRKYSPHQGRQECARRQKQMRAKGSAQVEYVGPDPRFKGETALGHLIASNVLEVHVDRLGHSHRFHQNASHWALRA